MEKRGTNLIVLGFLFILFLIYFVLHPTSAEVTGNVVAVPAVSSQLQECIPSWDCGWSKCLADKQICTYFDRNRCGSQIGKPVNLERPCKDQSQPTLVNISVGSVPLPRVPLSKNNFVVLGLVIFILLVFSCGAYLFYLKMNTKKIISSVAQPAAIVVKPLEVQQAITQPVVTAIKPVEIQQPVTQPVATVKPIDPLQDLKNYISQAYQQGQVESKIISDLLTAGWQKQDIESALGYVKLKKFFSDKLLAGFTKEKIIESLKSKGWKDELIQSLVIDLKL